MVRLYELHATAIFANLRRQIEEAHVGDSLVAALNQLLTPVHVGLRPALTAPEDLEQFNLARSVELLLSCLQHPRLEIRETAAWALYLGDTRAVEPLLACLKQEQNSSKRRRIMGALGQLGDGRAVEPLLVCLSQAQRVHEIFSAVSAVQALGQVGNGRAIGPLRALLGSLDAERLSSSQRMGLAVRQALFQLEWAQIGDGQEDQA